MQGRAGMQCATGGLGSLPTGCEPCVGCQTGLAVTLLEKCYECSIVPDSPENVTHWSESV